MENTPLTGKQKRFLRAMGATLDPMVQIGKAGITDTVVDSADQALTARELVKVRVLQNSPDEPVDAIADLAAQLSAEMVQKIGRNGLLFRRNAEKPRIELP